MNADQWHRLTDWHNAWLDADADGRLRLRAELPASQPDLVAPADDLLADSSSLREFLETPAFVLAARRMAQETMSLAAGAEVGPYRVVGLLAHGGMGIVYRATDLRLRRDVALKMLAPIGVPDEIRIERFLREARVTASIDHPNVIKVYDVGVFEGQPYIVAELLEGETLRAQLDRGRLDPTVARGIAIAIARGLVAAHAAGLVHRDLKPENIFLTRAGGTKVLDFGIAKLAPDPTRPRGAASTMTGMLLGTAAYLAPEQVRGEEVDARADLFALGSILFEAVTGQRAFAGDNTVDTLHAILHTRPSDRLRQPDEVPGSLATIVFRLLEKAAADRFQSAADLAWALEQPATRDAPPRSVANRGVDPRMVVPRWLPIAAALALAAIAVGTWRTLGASPVGSPADAPTRFTWSLPEGSGLFSAPAVSPDGRRICWAGGSEAVTAQLFVRDLSSLDAVPIAGTEGALHPFWSPNGQTIGFFSAGKLKRVEVGGGPPIVLADARNPRGGAWSQSGVIVFEPDYRDTPLMRVSDRGGPVEPVTFFDRAQEEVVHRWPAFLPDGIHFLYSIVSLRDERRGVYLGSVADSNPRSTEPLFASESAAEYVPIGDGRHGVLLTVGNGRIEYRPFDPVRRVLEGDARTIEVNAIGTSPHHAALLSATANVLAYGTVGVPWGSRFASIARDGSDLQFLSERELGGFPRISPDGSRLARTRVELLRENSDIWVDDLRRGSRVRLTTSVDHDVMPVWSPDGREVAYRSGTHHEPTIGFAAADGSGVTRTLACPQLPCETSDWSPDGTYLVVTVRGRDVWSVPLQPGATPRPLLNEAFTERDARVSPDGRWLAYVSDESGRPEISVRSLVGPPRRFVVSSGGGDQPVWRRDGGELFFAAREGRLQSVAVRSDEQNGLAFGAATRLNVPPLGERHWGTTYEVSADGRRVYFPHALADRPPREFGLILNWTALLK